MGNAGWDHVVDWLVVGSGAGAMTSAIVAHDLGASTLLLEKSPLYGGSSAMSGGGLWIPNNHLMAGVGIADSYEDALAYLLAVTGGGVSEARLRAYLDHAPEMVEYLCQKTRVELVALPEYPDYYPSAPGSRPGGRALEPRAFHARELGDEFLRMRETAIQELIMGRVSMTVAEARILFCKTPGWIGLTARLMAGYWLDLPWRLRSARDRNLGMGNALVGMLRASLLDRGVPIWLEAPARELVVEGGRVVGLVAERGGHPLRIRGTKGVVLAAGGFDASQAMREKYLPAPTRAEWSAANPTSTGDAIAMGLAVGAGLGLMDDAWWSPTTVVPGESRARLFVIEKSLPGTILVDGRGRRFVNEALPYNDVVNAMYAKNTPEAPTVPCWLVFDATCRAKYPLGPLLPGAQQPDWALPPRLRREYLKKADTLEGLARLVGVVPAGLRATVDRFNEMARIGKDLDFQRGETAIETYYGDANVKPNACLAPIEKPPFYAMETFAGDFGTKGGLTVDERARVLRESGELIPGLYAIGNCSSAAMGRTYPGPGSTLGPATTFGYVAARDACA
jgi:3-oxosteroid 1-dehydrogenase